mgnify:CR=1 FL=1|tara:strand:+ start:42 stop:572 length:531 start_codon:yes stop_codon:yes gene_type:complete
MKKIKLISNHGILFWITGLAGSGKTRIAEKISSRIRKDYGKTVILSGDEIRSIFNLQGYSDEERLKTVMKYCKLAKKITSQNINVILAVIGMKHELRSWNKKNQKNYIEIYIKSEVKNIIKEKKKKIYHDNTSQIVGIDIKAEVPKKPNIVLNNNFKKNVNQLSEELLRKINNLIN